MQPVTIYTIRSCPYCARAKNLLAQQNIPYREFVYEFGTPQMDALIRRTRHDTVPQVFIGDRFIGGSDDLYSLVQSGRLRQFL